MEKTKKVEKAERNTKKNKKMILKVIIQMNLKNNQQAKIVLKNMCVSINLIKDLKNSIYILLLLLRLM